ncbi:MAG TPA: arsenate reductase (glutaredoxin) [Mycobacteriales bacterium]|nr:arsenate reductase (glutaredoxin) [Mycobacteriales bacterium]
MTEPVTIWTNPRCSKSRGAEALLAERGVPVERVQYLDEPPSRAEVERVLGLLGTDDPRVLVRTGEPLYAELGLADAARDELLDALAAHPSLIERPVVVRGDRAVVARPPERLLELLDDPA